MNILPLITFIAAVTLFALFEFAWTWVSNRRNIPLDRPTWALLYWTMIVVLLIACGIMSIGPPAPASWIPFFIIAAIHVVVCASGETFYRITPNDSSTTNGSTNNPNSNTNSETNDLTKNGE